MRASFLNAVDAANRRFAPSFALGVASIIAIGCGGTLSTADSATDGGSADTGSGDASYVDGTSSRDASSDSSAGDAGCVADPVVGVACTPGVGACSPGDLCCSGEWTCNATTSTWTLERGGCACLVDAGSGNTLPDGGIAVASCDACTASEICVVTVSGGGPCLMPNDAGGCPNGSTASPGQCCDNSSTAYRCDARPSSCGQGLSCGCAMSLCQNCLCQGTSPGSSAVSTLNCACEYP